MCREAQFWFQNLARSRLSRRHGRRTADPPSIAVTMYYVYILLNEAKTRTYTGIARDVEKRLKEHNAGRVKSSRPYLRTGSSMLNHFPLSAKHTDRKGSTNQPPAAADSERCFLKIDTRINTAAPYNSPRVVYF